MTADTDDQFRTGNARRAHSTTARFVVAVFGLFVPFFGIVLGPVAIVMAAIARRPSGCCGRQCRQNSLVFGIVVTVVWGAVWLRILIPALTNWACTGRAWRAAGAELCVAPGWSHD